MLGLYNPTLICLSHMKRRNDGKHGPVVDSFSRHHQHCFWVNRRHIPDAGEARISIADQRLIDLTVMLCPSFLDHVPSMSQIKSTTGLFRTMSSLLLVECNFEYVSSFCGTT